MITLKLLMVPFFLFMISISGNRWGPSMAGWLAGLPVIAGPILYLLVLEHGPTFGTRAAIAALSAILASEIFNLAYGWTCRWHHYSIAAMMGLVAWLIVAIGLSRTPTTFVYAVSAAMLGVVLSHRFLPKYGGVISVMPTGRLDLILRMIAGAALTLLVTTLSDFVGAQWSGVLTVFPLLSLILSVSTHRAHGADFVLRLLRGMVLGRFSFAAFCLSLVWTLPRQSAEIAFIEAALIAVAVQWASKRLVAVGN